MDIPPSQFAYTFDHIAEIVDSFTKALNLTSYSLYLQDYGGPVGFRLITKHNAKPTALIIQNAVSHEAGHFALDEVPGQIGSEIKTFLSPIN